MYKGLGFIDAGGALTTGISLLGGGGPPEAKAMTRAKARFREALRGNATALANLRAQAAKSKFGKVRRYAAAAVADVEASLARQGAPISTGKPGPDVPTGNPNNLPTYAPIPGEGVVPAPMAPGGGGYGPTAEETADAGGGGGTVFGLPPIALGLGLLAVGMVLSRSKR